MSGVECGGAWMDVQQDGTLEVNYSEAKGIRVNTSIAQPVEVDKMYGPSAFFPIRVTADHERYGWIIEQERPKGDDMVWTEVAFVRAWPREAADVQGKDE